MHLKKNVASKSTPARKTSPPKPKAVAKVPLPEPVPATPAAKVPHKSVPAKDKAAANVSDSEDAKNSGLCTRSKQYKHDTPAHPAPSPTLTARKEQPSTSSSLSSVKIIRTRLKNDLVAAAAAAGANMGRRNSYNDAFDVAKCVSGFAKEFLVGQGKQPKINSGCGSDVVETAGSIIGTTETDKKALETVASTESVTIKRLLSIAKYSGGDEKLKKASVNRLKEDSKIKKYLGLGCARRSSEPVNIEQLKSYSNDDLKSVKSVASDSSDSNEAESLRRPEKVVGSAKSVVEKTLPKVARLNVGDTSHTGNNNHNRSGAALNSNGNGGTINNANKSGNSNANGDPVIIERIPSRKNSELKLAKRNRYPTSDEKTAMLNKKKVEEIGSAKNVTVDSKPADTDRKSLFAETKSKIADHNLSVKSLKPAASADVRAKKSPVTATASNPQKSVTKVKNNCVVKSSKVVKTDSSVCVDAKTAKSKAPAVEVEKKKPSFHDLMTFDDSDDEFLVPPKAPKPVIGKQTNRVEVNEQSDVSSTDDHLQQMPQKVSSASTSDAKCLSPELTPKTAVTIAKEITSCKEVPVLKAENASTEKHVKVAVSKFTKPATNKVVIDKLQTTKHGNNVCVVDEIIDLVTPKSEILDDSCENQTFALDMYDDSTEECEKLSSTSIPTMSSKHDLVVTTSTCGSHKIGNGSTEMSSISKTGEISIRGNSTSTKATADFKKPASQPPKSFFSTASSCVKSKTVKEEKPPQSAVTTSQKVFSVDSKKLIFKKNSYLTPTAAGSDMKDENGAKKSEAFSPDNENSVYAFEPDLPTTSPPFRRLKPVTPPKSICSNSIAVQVSRKQCRRVPTKLKSFAK